MDNIVIILYLGQLVLVKSGLSKSSWMTDVIHNQPGGLFDSKIFPDGQD